MTEKAQENAEDSDEDNLKVLEAMDESDESEVELCAGKGKVTPSAK